MKIDEGVVVASVGHDLPVKKQAPLRVDESADNVEPSADDLEDARQNYLRMDAMTRAYIDALARRFDHVEDDHSLN